MAKHMIQTMSIAPAILALDLPARAVAKRYARERGSYRLQVVRANEYEKKRNPLKSRQRSKLEEEPLMV